MYSHLTEVDPGGRIHMLIDRHERHGSLLVPKALGDVVVSTEILEPEYETSLSVATVLPGQPIPVSGSALYSEEARGAALGEADLHPTLDDLVSSAAASWQSALEGKTFNRSSTLLKHLPRKPRQDNLSPSGLILIEDMGVEEYLAFRDFGEFAGYVATAEEIAALEKIEAMARHAGNPAPPADGNYL